MNKPILCLDFDGVIHSYVSGWKGADVIPDSPVPGALEFLERANDVFDIQIFSSRSNQPGGILAMRGWIAKYWTEYLFEKQPELKEKFSEFFCPDWISFPSEKPPAFLTIDDRAITFTGTWPNIEMLRNFKPWYKKMRQIGLGTFEATPEMFALVNQALRSGRLSYGPLSQEFEQRFAALHGCDYGVLSNSGTSSLLVALQTLKKLHGWQSGDEVIVPALTFVASVNVILQARLKPVLVDIDDTYCINPDLIERAITHRTRAIMPVHLFGQPADMQAIRIIADIHNLKICEDSCEAAFASQGDGSISSWGDIGCHSFYMAHIVTTGVGGISLTNNRDYATMLRSLSNHGLSYKHLSASEEFDPMMLSRYFVFDSIGHSFRITELEAALGLAQLNDWQAIKVRRQACHQYFMDALADLQDLIRLPKVRPDVSFTPMMFPIADLRNPKQALMDHLTRRGVGVRDTVPLTNQPVYKGLFREGDYPNAKFMNEHGLYWPCHQGLTNEDLAYIVQSVKEFYG